MLRLFILPRGELDKARVYWHLAELTINYFTGITQTTVWSRCSLLIQPLLGVYKKGINRNTQRSLTTLWTGVGPTTLTSGDGDRLLQEDATKATQMNIQVSYMEMVGAYKRSVHNCKMDWSDNTVVPFKKGHLHLLSGLRSIGVCRTVKNTFINAVVSSLIFELCSGLPSGFHWGGGWEIVDVNHWQHLSPLHETVGAEAAPSATDCYTHSSRGSTTAGPLFLLRLFNWGAS